jgi:hypothetical protein
MNHDEECEGLRLETIPICACYLRGVEKLIGEMQEYAAELDDDPTKVRISEWAGRLDRHPG